MGSDEKSAYTSGVRIYIVRIGAHIIGGVYAALAAIAFTGLIGSGDPTQGTTYTLMAVTALVLGCLLYTSPSPRDERLSRMPSSA